MTELTAEQKEECEKIMNAVVDMWMTKIAYLMTRGRSFEDAFKIVKEEMLS